MTIRVALSSGSDFRGRTRCAATTNARRQRGWIGLIGLVLALVIVGLLAQKLLKTYGLLSGVEPSKSAAEQGSRSPGGVGPAPLDPTGSAPTPAAAMERARGMQNQVIQQANELNKQIDETAK